MGKMYFYDIMYLYKTYEDYVNEEKKNQEQQEAMYQEQISSQPDINSQMQKFKMPDMNSLTRNMTNSIPKFDVPKF